MTALHESTVSIGQRAETVAAQYLIQSGYEVLQRNYRRKHCEIDIVARRDGVLFFVEVKFRSSAAYGDGLDYITPAKRQRMGRAAATWLRDFKWNGEYCLAVIAVNGEYLVTDFIESIEV